MGRAEARRVDESHLTIPMPRLQTGGAEAPVSEAFGGGPRRVARRGGAPDDAVTVPAAQARLCKAKGRRVRKSRGVGTVADQGEQNARIRDTPSSASRIGDGELESRRPQARSAGKRQKRTWHALQQADVELELVPLHIRPLNPDERQADARGPVLRALEDEVVQRLAQLRVLTVERIREVVRPVGANVQGERANRNGWHAKERLRTSRDAPSSRAASRERPCGDEDMAAKYAG